MTVTELIKKLQEVEDTEGEFRVVGMYSQVYYNEYYEVKDVRVVTDARMHGIVLVLDDMRD